MKVVRTNFLWVLNFGQVGGPDAKNQKHPLGWIFFKSSCRGVDISWDYEYYRRDYAGLQKITVGITRDYKKKTVGIIKIAVRRSGLHRDYIGITKTNVGIINWDY